ncbi:MAG: UDP-N-acetylmuramate dehydrogenase [Planctomycetes bacterium]|nr:UDP-N-acetylmuramate dehydrogenase [Planctomycetota bacterium]
MASTNVSAELKDFADFVQAGASLAAFTQLKMGGPAELLVQPRSLPELRAFLKRCFDKELPFRILGNGGNVLVQDEGVSGIILRLAAPAFTQISTEGSRLKAGAGATLAAVIAHATHHGLAGLETLIGLPGTLGGALLLNAGDRSSDIGQFVRRIEVIDNQAAVRVREHDEMRFTSAGTILEDPVLLSAEFDLETDRADAIIKRLRKAWIQYKASQPYSYQRSARIFKNPPGLNAAALIEQTGLVGTTVGGAQVSDRNANCIMVETAATARDVIRLIDLIRTRVQDRFRLELELAISVW